MSTSSEVVIDSRLPYRIGCPILPAMPVKTLHSHNVEASGPIPGYRESDITGVLAKHEILVHGILLAGRATDGMDPKDSDPITLVILSTYKDGCQEKWVNAVKEMRTNLVQNKIDWTIELVDRGVYYESPEIGPILSTDKDIIQGWAKVRPDFFEIIEARDWVSVEVFYRDFPSREKQPSVIICARDAGSSPWWDSTIPALKQLLQANDLNIDIVLLYSKGQW